MERHQQRPHPQLHSDVNQRTAPAGHAHPARTGTPNESSYDLEINSGVLM